MASIKTPQAHYNATSNLWISLGVTAITAILNVVFIAAVLAQKSSFLLYTFSPKQGVNTSLLDISEAAWITSIWVIASIGVTLLVALLVFFKQRDWLRLVIMFQVLFIGIGLSFIVNSVIRIAAGTEFISYVASGAVTLISVAAAVYYVRIFNPQVSRSRKSKRQK